MSIMTDLNQYLKNRNSHWHYHRRVPLAYEELDRRGTIRTSLKTTSLEVARVRRDAMAEADELYWSSLAASDGTSIKASRARYQAAKKRAMSRGFIYTPVEELAETTAVSEILNRLALFDPGKGQEPKLEKKDAEALLGGVEPVAMPVSKAFRLYCDQIATSDLLGKSGAQKHNWHKAKKRAVNNFINICGDLPMNDITRKHAQQFREWWASRLRPKGGKKALNPNSANRDIGNMKLLYQAYWDYEGETEKANPFDKMRFAKAVYKDIPPFDTEWVRSQLLNPDIFGNLNREARLIIYAMIETGCRPSEIVNLDPKNIILDHEVPHLQIRQQGDRHLKTQSSVRDIPLLGVSLEAFQQAPNGFSRYRDKSSNLSALLMKTFRAKGLFPTDDHRIYSIRHSFEKRMLEAGLDYGLRCTLMGHHNNRPAYGDGGSLEYRRDELKKIIFDVPLSFRLL